MDIEKLRTADQLIREEKQKEIQKQIEFLKNQALEIERETDPKEKKNELKELKEMLFDLNKNFNTFIKTDYFINSFKKVDDKLELIHKDTSTIGEIPSHRGILFLLIFLTILNLGLAGFIVIFK
jgi:hypothetical protein